MAIAESVRRRTRANPRAVTAVVSVLGYALVVAAFAGLLPIPGISDAVGRMLAGAIAVINTFALASLLVGWRAIKRRNVDRHRTAMLAAFALILLFLVVYLVKVNGAGEVSITASGVALWVYRAMLVVHIVLSAVSVPVVVHAVVLGLTHTPAELADTAHPRVGRIAATVWSLSLGLGIITFVMLTAYGSEPRGAEGLLALLVGRPADE